MLRTSMVAEKVLLTTLNPTCLFLHDMSGLDFTYNYTYPSVELEPDFTEWIAANETGSTTCSFNTLTHHESAHPVCAVFGQNYLELYYEPDLIVENEFFTVESNCAHCP